MKIPKWFISKEVIEAGAEWDKRVGKRAFVLPHGEGYLILGDSTPIEGVKKLPTESFEDYLARLEKELKARGVSTRIVEGLRKAVTISKEYSDVTGWVEVEIAGKVKRMPRKAYAQFINSPYGRWLKEQGLVRVISETTAPSKKYFLKKGAPKAPVVVKKTEVKPPAPPVKVE